MENLRQIIKEVISGYKFNKVYILTENFSANVLLSEHLKYHIDNNIAPLQSIFRAGSQAHVGLLNEVRVLWENQLLDLDEEIKELFETSDLGKYGIFEGKKVPLDFPMEEEIEDKYGEIVEEITTYGDLYEEINLENSYKDIKLETNNLSFDFIFKDKHNIERKLIYYKSGGSIKLLWLDPDTNKWSTEDIPRKYQDEKVMNTFGNILVNIILPKYKTFTFRALNSARYRLFRALIYNNLDTNQFNLNFDNDKLEIEVKEKSLLEAEYQGKKVELGKPKRGGSKKFYVYVKDPKTKKVKKVSFGAPGMSVGIKDPKRRRAFAKRHKCAQKTDRTKPSFWSCNVGRYAKLLGLGKNFYGFW